MDGERIVLKKYEPACVFCGDAANVHHFRGKNICDGCLRDMKHLIVESPA